MHSHGESSHRGRILMQSMALRLLGGILGSCFLAFCFNGRKHLGWFHWELTFEVINLIMCGMTSLMTVLWLVLSQKTLPTLPLEDVQIVVSVCIRLRSIMASTSAFHNATTYCHDAWNLHRRVSKTLCTSLFAKFMIFPLNGFCIVLDALSVE